MEPPGPERLFRRLQLPGWALCGIVYYLAGLPFLPGRPAVLLLAKLGWAAFGYALSRVLGRLYRALGLPDRGPLHAIAVVLLLSLLGGALWIAAFALGLTLALGSPRPLVTLEALPFTLLNHSGALLAWSGAYFSFELWERARLEERRGAEALALASQARLEALRYQLQPHFLFNALNSVRALIGTEPEQARSMITRLAEFLRYTLEPESLGAVSVAEEIGAVARYLEIEKVRFEERLKVRLDIEAGAAQRQVPAFLLHPLVENAVRHGRPRPGGSALEIGILARLGPDGGLRLEVESSGRLAGTGEGVGLRNVRERLQAVYPGAHSFQLAQDGESVRASIAIRDSVA